MYDEVFYEVWFLRNSILSGFPNSYNTVPMLYAHELSQKNESFLNHNILSEA